MASAALAVGAYGTPAVPADALRTVVVLSVLSHAAQPKIVVALEHVATTSSGVPPLYAKKIQMRKGTLLLDVPSVAPDGIVRDNAAVIDVACTAVPVLIVVERNNAITGLPAVGVAPDAVVRLIVSAFAVALADKPILVGMSKPVEPEMVPHDGPVPLAYWIAWLAPVQPGMATSTVVVPFKLPLYVLAAPG